MVLSYPIFVAEIRHVSGKREKSKEVLKMPFIHVRTARPIPDAARQTMTRTLGRDIRLLGKSEEWLMLQIEGNCALAFRGQEDSDAAFVYVGLLGRADGAQTERLTAAICAMLEKEMSLPPDHVYVQYVESTSWGWNGSNF